jgi:hypothetical protein
VTAVSTAVLEALGTVMPGSAYTPFSSVTPLTLVPPVTNANPFGRTTDTSTLGFGVPAIVKETETPSRVVHPTAEYDVLSNASTRPEAA